MNQEPIQFQWPPLGTMIGNCFDGICFDKDRHNRHENALV
jgi:hypothetical protein